MQGKDIYIKKINNIVVLIPKDNPWESLIHGLNQFSPHFMEERNQPPQQEREGWLS